MLALFILGLVLSGITSFPLQRELEALASVRGLERMTPADAGNAFDHWILTVRDGLRETYARHPWLAYGMDWLAFAHLVIALFFIGPLVNPVRNIWILQAGIIACVLIVPLALICGAIRQVPLGWRSDRLLVWHLGCHTPLLLPSIDPSSCKAAQLSDRSGVACPAVGSSPACFEGKTP